MKCLLYPVYEKVIHWRIRTWQNERQLGCSSRDRPRAREASENIIWWLQEKSIVEGTVFGFFSAEVKYMEDYPMPSMDGLEDDSGDDDEDSETSDTTTYQGIWSDRARTPPRSVSEPGGEPLPTMDGGDSN